MMMGYGGFGFGWLGMLIPLVLIILVVYFIFRMINRGDRTSGRDSNAEAILADRFARGEISQEEFEHMSQVLRKN